MFSLGLNNSRLIAAVFSLLYFLAITNLVSSGDIQFGNCASPTQPYSVSRVNVKDITDNTECPTGASVCTVVNGHDYQIDIDACGTATTLVRVIPYNVKMNITLEKEVPLLPPVQVPIVTNYPVSNGDLCSSIISSNPSSCPIQPPACATFRVTFTSPLPPLPSNITLPLGGAPGTIIGRAWANDQTSNDDAAVCVKINILYKLTP